jgi:hypothetical protein
MIIMNIVSIIFNIGGIKWLMVIGGVIMFATGILVNAWTNMFLFNTYDHSTKIKKK